MRYPRARLFVCSLGHFAVDMACFFALFSGALKTADAALYVLIYNALAFALQAPFGAVADRLDDLRPMAVLGLGLAAWGVMARSHAAVSVALLGLGNALYHVAGAGLSLRPRPGDGLWSGFFVSTGALGVVSGILWASDASVTPMFVVFTVFIAILLILAAGRGENRCVKPQKAPMEVGGLGAFALTLLLLSIGIRSFTGFASVSPEGLLLIGGCAAFLGKLTGGMLSRKLPWRVVGLVAAGTGGLMMAFFPGTWAVIAGSFILNMAMPVTLSAVMASLPGHMCFGFGATTLALFLGTLPFYVDSLEGGVSPFVTGALAVISALMLFFALTGRKPVPTSLPDEIAELPQDGVAADLPERAPEPEEENHDETVS